MREGDVALTPLPQADGRIKNRPVVVLRQLPPFGDWLVCGISTQLHHEAAGFDEIIGKSDTDFAGSGLKAASLIRHGFLGVLASTSFIGAIGSISLNRHRGLLKNYRNN